MAYRAATIERLLETVREIAASPSVGQYKIGRTGNFSARSGAYRGVGFQHIVALAANLTSDQARELEMKLQAAAKEPAGGLLYDRYDHLTRDKGYADSNGGKEASEKGSQHSVYMAWWR